MNNVTTNHTQQPPRFVAGTRQNKLAEQWQPSEKQRALAIALTSMHQPKSLASIAKEHGIGGAVYEWMRDPRFVEYLNSLLPLETDSKEYEVWQHLFQAIEKDNVQAIKLYFEVKGKINSQSQNIHNEQNNIYISGSDLLKEADEVGLTLPASVRERLANDNTDN